MNVKEISNHSKLEISSLPVNNSIGQHSTWDKNFSFAFYPHPLFRESINHSQNRLRKQLLHTQPPYLCVHEVVLKDPLERERCSLSKALRTFPSRKSSGYNTMKECFPMRVVTAPENTFQRSNQEQFLPGTQALLNLPCSDTPASCEGELVFLFWTDYTGWKKPKKNNQIHKKIPRHTKIPSHHMELVPTTQENLEGII